MRIKLEFLLVCFFAASCGAVREILSRDALCTVAARDRAWTRELTTCEGRSCFEQAFGKMLWQMSEKAARLRLAPYPDVTAPAGKNRWTRGFGCEKNVDFWECMYGKPVPYPNCDGHVHVRDVRVLRAAYLFNWLLYTTKQRLSFLPFPVPITNASVHVRLGDSCEVRVDRPRPKSGKMWGTGRRHCVSPLVHARVARQVLSPRVVLHLATDDEKAVQTFRNASGGRRVIVSDEKSEKRRWYEKSEWIEFRKDVAPDAAALSVNDLVFLSHGQYFVFSACGYYAHVAHAIASFRHGRWLESTSVDECVGPR